MAQSNSKATSSQQDALTQENIDTIRAHLEKLLEDQLFRDTTRMKRFLRYVTEETLEGRSDRLKGYTIGLEVFDRPEDFDPQTDTIVRVQAGQLRRRLDLYYAEKGESDPVRLTIPKGRYAPRFEFREDAPAVQDGSILELVDSSPISSIRPGIAVMTFENLTPSDQPDFFAEGLTSEILSALVQFRNIRVVAMRPNLTDKTMALQTPDIAKRYDVQFVLSGSVRRSGDVFRVSVALIAAMTGQVLYNATFDRKYSPDTMFEVQEAVASNVAAAIAAPFGQINRYNRRLKTAQRQSLSAYEAVLKFYEMGLAPSQEKAQSLLAEVTELTSGFPNFSSGLAIRAMLHVFLCTQCIPPADGKMNLERADELSEKAVKVDPQNSLCWFARFQALYHAGRFADSEAMSHRALELNPNDYSMLAYFAITRAHRGQAEVATACQKSALQLIGNPPKWFAVADMITSIRQQRYADVDDAVGDVTPQDSVSLWFLKMAALGHLGKETQGRALFKALSEPFSATAEDWMQTLDYWQPQADLRQLILEGWRKAGMAL